MGLLKLLRKDKETGTSKGQVQADKALAKASGDLRKAERDTPEITRKADILKRYGEQNNFARAIKEALGGAK